MKEAIGAVWTEEFEDILKDLELKFLLNPCLV